MTNPIWATSLGSGKTRGTITFRRAARAARVEANEKFWAIGSTRRVGRLKELRRYGGHIIAVYVMEGIPTQPTPSGLSDRMQEWIEENAAACRQWSDNLRGHANGQ